MLFRKHSKPMKPPIIPLVSHVQQIAVWGSPHSGKTTTAVQLACSAARAGRDVILVLADMSIPELPILLPSQILHADSLGELLTNGEITQDRVLNSCIVPGHADYLSLLGYRAGENERTYPDYTRDQATDLFLQLRHMAQVIIVDCSSLLHHNVLSAIAFDTSDRILLVGNCGLASPAFFNSQLPLVSDRLARRHPLLPVLNDVRSGDPVDEYMVGFNRKPLVLQHADEIETNRKTGRCFERLMTRKGRRYEACLEQIWKEAFS